MNTISIDPRRTLGAIDRNVFGGFVEHLGRCIYGGIYDEGSRLSDERGFRRDVIEAVRRLRMPIMRYPGGNFVSGYRWRDGVGPLDERPARMELAWKTVESNRFGTDEFVRWCREVNTEPYLVVNCGEGNMREARDWVEYCNGAADTALVRLRRRNGSDAPHGVQYWGVGNEVDGPWQMGMKTPEEYARALAEYAKLMKLVDPSIKVVASWTSGWFEDWVERGQLLLEQAADLIDYMAIHWYVANKEDDFCQFMGLSELIEERLTAAEGLLAAMRTCRKMRSCRKIERPIYLAVDEWNVWYRTGVDQGHEEGYNLEDALVVAMHLNGFIRHARSVKMANLAQVVNVLAPILTRPDGLLLQSIYYPFELFSEQAGDTALDAYWEGDTFQAGEVPGLRVLDVSATLGDDDRQLALFIVNRSLEPSDVTITLQEAAFAGEGGLYVVEGAGPKAMNTFADPEAVAMRSEPLTAGRGELILTLEPHSITGLVLPIR